MTILHLPDILSSLSNFEAKISPHRKRVTDASNAWFKSLNLLTPDLYQDFLKADYPLIVAMAYPDADEERLRVIADYYAILFTYDDLMDFPIKDEESATMHKKEGARTAGDMLMTVFNNPNDFNPVPGHPVITPYHDFWIRYKSNSSPSQQKRFVDFSFEYVRAAEDWVGMREQKSIPSLEEYMDIRRKTSAIRGTFVLLEYMLQMDVPEEAYNHPEFQAASDAANDILGWSNDLYSFNNEQARGDYHNMIALVSLQRNIPIQEAITFLHGMILDAIQRFWFHRANIPSFSPEADRITEAYMKAMEIYTVGSVDWHLLSERYLGAEVLEVRRTLEVTVKPPEPGVVLPFEFNYVKTQKKAALHKLRKLNFTPSEAVEVSLVTLLIAICGPVYLWPLLPLVLLLFLPPIPN